MRGFLMFVPLVLICGCVATYKRDVVTQPSVKLVRGAAVLISTPKNGSYYNKEYHASGQQTAEVIHTAFASFSDRVVVSSRCADLPCLKSESSGDYQYLVVPEILHWEDRNTEWSSIPDRIVVKLVVIDEKNGAELAATVISGKSKWTTFGGDHPQDLLPAPIKQYVAELY
jgi:hypothetical protein